MKISLQRMMADWKCWGMERHFLKRRTDYITWCVTWSFMLLTKTSVFSAFIWSVTCFHQVSKSQFLGDTKQSIGLSHLDPIQSKYKLKCVRGMWKVKKGQQTNCRVSTSISIFLLFFLKFYFIFKPYKIVLVLPNIKMYISNNWLLT